MAVRSFATDQMNASRQSSVAWVTLVIAVFAASACAGLGLAQHLGRISSIWFSTAILVAALVLSPRARWPWLVSGAFATNVLLDLWFSHSLPVSVGTSTANAIEALIAAIAIKHSERGRPDLMHARTLVRFFVFAVVLAPAISALIAGVVFLETTGAAFDDTFSQWWAADALGMGIVVPLVLAVRPSELIESIRTHDAWETFGPFALLLVIATLVFTQNTFPVLFLLFPPLLFIAFRWGFAGTAIAISICAAIAIAFTTLGFGPFMLIGVSVAHERITILQLLLATLILTTYPVCSVVAAQETLLRDIAGSEERFRALAANSIDIIALTDMNGIWRYMSPAVTAAFGWLPEDLIGKDGMTFVHPDDAAIYRGGIDLLRNGQQVLSGSFRMRARDGRYIWVETISRAIHDSKGNQTGWVSNTRDITARKRVEELKNEFIATVSHELRTPLTAMLGAVGLAASGKFGQVNEGLQRLLDLAKTNGDRLSRLVDDILDFEKASSGKMQFVIEAHSVATLLERAINDIRPYATQSGVQFTLSATLPDVAIRVDAIRFQQVLANLLSNAAKFSESGSEVRVSAKVVGDRCRISVADRGCGIPPEFRATLFDRFSQADASDQRQRGGTGLGMAIAKHFTEQMDGTISFESEVDVGTTFFLEFPLALGSPRT